MSHFIKIAALSLALAAGAATANAAHDRDFVSTIHQQVTESGS